MSASHATGRFTVLPDEHTLTATAAALEEHRFSVEVVDNLAAAREVVLARIPAGSSVMTNTSMTLQDTAIAPHEQQAKVITEQPDYALGSVHAVTKDGTLLIASATGSQLGSYAWGAANVIFIVGAQKLVPTLDAAHQRIYQHSLPLEDARARPPTASTAASGRSSRSTGNRRTASTSS